MLVCGDVMWCGVLCAVVMVALKNNEVRVYKDKYLVNTLHMDVRRLNGREWGSWWAGQLVGGAVGGRGSWWVGQLVGGAARATDHAWQYSR